MKKITFLWAFFLISLLIGTAQNFENTEFDLNINIQEFKHLKGKVYIALYNHKDHFRKEDKIYKYQIIPVDHSQQKITFEHLPKGVYAISVYHDVNDNQKLDTNFMGIPKEPYGFSNNPRIFMGPPSFEEAHIVLDHSQEIAIVLK